VDPFASFPSPPCKPRLALALLLASLERVGEVGSYYDLHKYAVVEVVEPAGPALLLANMSIIQESIVLCDMPGEPAWLAKSLEAREARWTRP
jgi:hypothetical protein